MFKHCNLRWPRGIMGFTHGFRNYRLLRSAIRYFCFQNSITIFNAQLRFRLSTTIRLFNAQLRLQLSTFICDSTFQRSAAIYCNLRWPRGIMGFTHGFRNYRLLRSAIRYFCFQNSITIFNAQLRFRLSTTIRLFNAQLRLQLSTFICDSTFQRSAAIPTFNRDLHFSVTNCNSNCNY